MSVQELKEELCYYAERYYAKPLAEAFSPPSQALTRQLSPPSAGRAKIVRELSA